MMDQTTDTVIERLFNADRDQMRAWVEQTQARATHCEQAALATPISIPSTLHGSHNEAELLHIMDRAKLDGFAVYAWSDTPANVTDSVGELLQSLGLSNSDSGVIREAGELSLLHDATGTPKARFPPYQSKVMNWHTDGYYNAASDVVRCFTLHCVEPAAQGGALVLLDDTFAVLALLREDPNLVALLSHSEAMTLPNNRDNDGHDRPDRTVPMIYQNTDNTISMRFTTRSQNIHWRCYATEQAAQRATQIIKENSQWHIKLRLEKGQGVITRNILHTREQFVDVPGEPKRQMLRGRFTQLPFAARTTSTKTQSSQSSKEQTHVTR